MIIMICAAFTVKTFQNDTFYTVKVGESILEHGIDMKDHFSWHELEYTYPHWLFDIIIYKIHDLGGLNALYIANILVFIAIHIILVNIILIQKNGNILLGTSQVYHMMLVNKTIFL